MWSPLSGVVSIFSHYALKMLLSTGRDKTVRVKVVIVYSNRL